MTAIVGASAALAGFVVTVTVLFVQVAAGSFSARYMRIWYRDWLLKAALAALVGRSLSRSPCSDASRTTSCRIWA